MNGQFLAERHWAVAAVVMLGLGGIAMAQDAAKTPEGAAIFSKKCVLCHGADGTGNTPLGKQVQAANLHSKAVQSRSDDELHTVVHDGQTNMPSFAEQLSDDEIAQVIQYVRTFGAPAKAAKKQ